MKKFLPLITFLLFLIGCSDDSPEGIQTFEITDESVDFSADAQGKEVLITTNLSEWESYVDASGTEWCTVSPVVNGNKKAIIVQVEENKEWDVRSTTIQLKGAGILRSIKISQLGVKPTILVSPDRFTPGFIGEQIELKITANVSFDLIDSLDWVNPAPTLRSAEMSTTTVKYVVSRNASKEARTGIIYIREKDNKANAQVTIIQAGEGDYQPSTENAINDDIKLAVASAEASSFQSGSELVKSVDNDKSTIYHSNWSNTAANYFPITLTYNLKEASDLDYLIYYPRTSGSNGHFKEVEIQVKKYGQNMFEKLMDYDFKGSSSATRIGFDQSIRGVASVRFIVKSGVGDGQGFAACAEMEFYRKNPDNFDPAVLFTDESCSELKAGITEADIEAVSNPFFKNIAYYMLRGSYPREFRIQQYKAYPDPNTLAASNKTNPYSLLDNPTGISVAAYDTLIVCVGETHNQSLSLKVQNLNKAGGDGYSDGSSSYPLVKGINKIVPANRGLIYVMYHTKQYASVQPVTIHFASGKVNGYFDVKKHTAGQWSTLLNNAVDDYFDVLGEYAHLTFPVYQFKNNTPDGKTLIDVYDDIARLEQEFMGLAKYDRMNPNRMYLHVIYTSYMYATNNRTAYNNTTLGELTNASKVRGSSIWGPAHEIGHVNQTRPGLKWHGMTEVSNNIYSLFVQTSFGNTSRLQGEDMSGEGYTNRYEKAMSSMIAKKLAHARESDVFCKLVPFWQLQLYMSNVLGKTDFYKDVHEAVRTTTNQSTDGLSQLEFTKICCNVAKLDLTDFFLKWGLLSAVDYTFDDYGERRFLITESQAQQTIDAIKAMNYPKPSHALEYITDLSVATFKTNGAIQKGSVSKTGLQLSFTNWKNVVAFEVYNNSELVFISPASSFTSKSPFTQVYAVAANGTKVKVDW